MISIREAMAVIDAGAISSVYFVDEDGKFAGFKQPEYGNQASLKLRFIWRACP